MAKANRDREGAAKGSALETVFLILTGVFLLWQFLGTTTFYLSYPSWFNKLLFASMAGTAALRLLFLGTKELKARDFWICLLTAAVYVFVFLRDRYVFLLYTAVMTVGLRRIDYRKVLRVFLLSVGIGLLVTVMAGLPGVITNFVYVKTRRGVRSSWGICYPTDFATIVLFLLMTFWVYFKRLPDWFMLFFCALSALLSGCFAYSSTSLICSLLLAAAVVYHMLEEHLVQKQSFMRHVSSVVNLFLEAAFPLCGTVFFVFLYLYRRGNGVAIRMDQILTSRLKLALDAWQKYGIHPFGTPFDMIGSGFASIGSSDYNFVDSTYPLLLLRYGVVLLFVLCFLWMRLTKKAVRYGDRRLAFVLAIIAFHSFSEHHFIEAHYNIFLILPFAMIPKAAVGEVSAAVSENRNVVSVDQEYVWQEKRWLAAACIAAASGTVGILIAAPAFLSYLKTFCEIKNLIGGGRSGWSVFFLNLFLLLLIAGVLFNGYLILENQLKKHVKTKAEDTEKYIEASAGGNAKKARNAGQPWENEHHIIEKFRNETCVFLVCAFSLACSAVYAGHVFNKSLKSEEFKELFQSERPVMELITGAAKEKVYAGTLPVLYKKQFPSIFYSYFSGEELARNLGSTVIVDCDNEYACLLKCGFLYSRISEGHAVYTGDRAVVKALTDAGFPVTSFYSTARSVNLRYEARLNGLPISEQKGLRLKGAESEEGLQKEITSEEETEEKALDGISMQLGPYLDLYSGRYTLTLHLSVSKKALQEEGAVCNVQITTEWGKKKLLEKEITTADFNADGKASVPVIFSVGNVPGVEFPIIAAPGRTVYVQGIDYQKTPELDTHAFYDKKMRLIREEYYDGSGQPTANFGVYYAMEQDYDEKGNLASRRFYDAEGKLTLRIDGYAEVRWQYNLRKQVIREEFFGLNGEPVVISGRQAANEREYDEEGNVTVLRYYGTDGKPILTTGGYAELHRRYNDDKKIIFEEYIGTDGQPIMQEGGYTAQEQEFDGEGNVIRRRFLSEGKPVMRTDGYAEVRWDYNGLHQVIRESFYDSEGNLVRLNNGSASNEREYDVNGNVICYRYFDEEGNPAIVSGYAELRRRFDERRQILWEGYFGPDGNPVLLAGGYASLVRNYTDEGIGRVKAQKHYGLSGEPVRTTSGYFEYRREFDGHGNKIRESYFDVDGNLVNCSSGYAVLCRTYDEKENVSEEWYLDIAGNPVVRGTGYAKITFEYDDNRQLFLTHYLDAEGNPVKAGSANFHEYLMSLASLRKEKEITVFLSVKEEAMNALTPPILEDFKALGLQTELLGRTHCSYYAVLGLEETLEEIDPLKLLSREGTVDGRVYTITSAGLLVGNESSILIDGTEYSKNHRGMNFVIYDHNAHQVTDAVCFDTYVQEMTEIR